MKKIILLLCLILAIFILRESSSVDEYEARQIALDILSEKHSNRGCGGNFENYLKLDQEHPLGISHTFNIDTSGYTFESDNGRCTVIIYVYKYWGGYEYAFGPN